MDCRPGCRGCSNTSSVAKNHLHTLCLEGKLGAVQSFLRDHPGDLNRRDGDHRTPLHWASSGGSVDVCEFLLGQTGIEVDTVDESGWSPIMSATSAGHVDVLSTLLRAGASANTPNDSGAIPLHYHKGKVAILAALLPATASVDTKDKYGATALLKAAQGGHVEAARALIRGGASVNARMRNGDTPLHAACEAGCEPVACLLVRHGADMRATNSEGKIAIELATPTLARTLADIALGTGEEKEED